MHLKSNNPSIFYISLILSCLEKAPRGILSFLIEQRSPHWSWNYTSRGAEQYPDDLDDTFITLSALYLHDPTLLTEEAMVSIVKLLIKNEVCPGGPYYTWDTSHENNPDWNDVDLVVNSNIMHFCTQVGIDLPSLVAWIEGKIAQESFESKYYKSPVVIIYFLSKWYRGIHQECLIEKLFTSTWENPMEIALAISACIKLGAHPSRVSESIKELIQYTEQGTIESFPFFIERVVDGEIFWSGSAAFTSACIAEAFSLYRNTTDTLKPAPYNAIISQVIVRTLGLVPVSKQITELQKTSLGNQVILLPFLCHKNCTHSALTSDEILNLCVATLLGWIGYTLYDNILDGDAHYSNLPLANICSRETSFIFNSFTSSRLIPDTLNGIDTANQWEHTNCKQSIIGSILSLPEDLPHYDNYAILAEKSLGYAIAPMIIVGVEIKEFFIPYLIARQLNDDAHDWFSDLQKGFLNPVSVLIISEWKKRYPYKHEIDLTTEKDVLQEIFWYTIIDTIVQRTEQFISSARKQLPLISTLKDSTFLEELLSPLEQSAKRALAERDSALRFLKHYYK